jgi:hypothetical protein
MTLTASYHKYSQFFFFFFLVVLGFEFRAYPFASQTL